MNEKSIFSLIACVLSEKQRVQKRVLRIAVNGIEGTGKTVFTEKLTQYLQEKGLNIFHVSIDGFHFHTDHRYKQGKNSAKGYYEDCYNERSFAEEVLLASQKDKPYFVPAIHDIITDRYLDATPVYIPSDSVLITDGSYLFKPIYRKHWDIKVYIKTDFSTAMKRGITRDSELLGGDANAEFKYLHRYHKASQMYINENKPEDLADIIIDNTDFNNILLLKNTFGFCAPTESDQ